ncbi:MULTISPECIES: SDR family oxidoreductase [Haloferax]|uniref:NAD-dependent epimerase/dehydratase family protein n=1 Tax=Haloferax marinum TaxID=2666143 RepID=A0A6A8G2A7_9EURY|nr:MULTISPECIES: SDR family oxidoreductase [Haloferax]KAB1196262.1 SDR family oxidoreductase [Haloferax sp. CBA1150]MRW95250.1 NAD-dependent epimerase/dehydratase family protein [Haloferax marinum]
MQILITGGAGFIGSQIAERFIGGGHDVITLDNFDPYYSTSLKEYNVELCREVSRETDGSFKLVKGDIRDEDLVNDLVEDVDIVFHKAAQAGVRKSVENPQKPNDVNVGGTLNVLNAARKNEVERVVVASSSSIYGVSQYLPFDESHPARPVSPYGVSKLATEQYSRVFYEVYGLPTVSLRYFTVYGPRMRPNMAISNFVSRCMNGKSPIIFGDGSQTRDFTYISDAVNVNEKLLTDSSADGQILNVGSNHNISIQELAETVVNEINPGIEIEYASRFEGDAEHTHADVTKLKDVLGYEPSVSIRHGVKEFIDWYKSEREWYEPLIYDGS